MERLEGIYMIISPTAKVYIGQSNNLLRRVNDYKQIGCKTQVRLYNSLIKHGWENHLFEVIEYCSIEKLNERERYWQDVYEVIGAYGMNCKLTALKDRTGRLSDETKMKISIGNTGKIKSDAAKLSIGQKNKGKVRSDEAKTKISIAKKGKASWNKGKTTSAETRLKISMAIKAYRQKQKDMNGL